MAAAAAAFDAILRIAYVGLEASRWGLAGRGGLIAAATMIVGAVLSVTQTDVKRLLAYSSVATQASSSSACCPSTATASQV